MVYDIIFSDNFDHAFKNDKQYIQVFFNTDSCIKITFLRFVVFGTHNTQQNTYDKYAIKTKITGPRLSAVFVFVIVYSPNSKPSFFSPLTHIYLL